MGRRRYLRTFSLSPLGWVTLVLGLLVLAYLGLVLFGRLGMNPLGGALMLPCAALLALSVVDRVRWGGRRTQHLVGFGERQATVSELREICADLGRRGVAAEVEQDEHGRAVLGFSNADTRTVVAALVARGASAPRSGW